MGVTCARDKAKEELELEEEDDEVEDEEESKELASESGSFVGTEESVAAEEPEVVLKHSLRFHRLMLLDFPAQARRPFIVGFHLQRRLSQRESRKEIDGGMPIKEPLFRNTDKD